MEVNKYSNYLKLRFTVMTTYIMSYCIKYREQDDIHNLRVPKMVEITDLFLPEISSSFFCHAVNKQILRFLIYHIL